MGLRDKLHHHHTSKVDPLTSERAGLAAENPNNPPTATTGMALAPGVAPLPVVMPGTAAGYTKPVYVPLDSLPQGTRIPMNQGGPHVYNEHGQKHTVDAAVAATVEALGGPAVNRHGDPHLHDPNNPEKANVVTRRGNVGVTDTANPVLISGMSTLGGVAGLGTAPAPVPKAAPAPVPVAAPAPVPEAVPRSVPAPVPVPVPVKESVPEPVAEQPRSVAPVPVPVPIASETANLPPAGHANHNIPLTATGPVTEIVDEPTRSIEKVPGPDGIPATEVPRSTAVPVATPPVAGTGSLPTMVAQAIDEPEIMTVPATERAVEPVAAMPATEKFIEPEVAAAPIRERAVEPVVEQPREVPQHVEPVAPKKTTTPRVGGVGIKPAGVTQPIDVVHDVAGGEHEGTDNHHAVSVHDQPKKVDAGAF